MTRLAIALIRLYQRWVSRFLPSVCRFQPTCSNYAIQALQQHGFWRGGWLGLRRLCRCHPFSPGGYDPVPPAAKSDTTLYSGDKPSGDSDGPPQ